MDTASMKNKLIKSNKLSKQESPAEMRDFLFQGL